MKKLQLLVLVLVLVAFGSCKKESTNQPETSKYVNTISGTVKVIEGDVLFKTQPDAPVGTGREFMCYKKSGNTWAHIDGSEFITGSAAYNDWQTGLALNPQFVWKFPMDQIPYVTYCPVMPLRFAVKTMQGSTPAYLGMYDCTPNANSFPISVYCKRLGDVLTINRKGLQIPNYDFTIKVDYKTSLIDVDATMLKSDPTSPTEWLDLEFVDGQTDVPASFNVPAYVAGGNDDIVVYNGFDKKIVGDILITITDTRNNVHFTKTLAVPEEGKRYAISLETKDKGWYNSGQMNPITENDIVVSTVVVNVDDNN